MVNINFSTLAVFVQLCLSISLSILAMKIIAKLRPFLFTWQFDQFVESLFHRIENNFLSRLD